MQQFGAGVPEYDDDGYFYYGDESQEDFVSPEYAPEPYDMGINLQHPSEIDNMEQQPGMWTETLAVASDNSSSKVASGCFDEELEMYWVGTESGRVIGFECPVMEKHCAFHAHNNAVTAMTTINQVSFFMSLLLILKVGLFTGSTDSVRLFTKGGCHVMRHQFVLFSNFQSNNGRLPVNSASVKCILPLARSPQVVFATGSKLCLFDFSAWKIVSEVSTSTTINAVCKARNAVFCGLESGVHYYLSHSSKIFTTNSNSSFSTQD